MTGPWRRDFDAARDPYTARNALGITSTGGGGGGGAPNDAEYIVAATDATLTNERVLTNTATVTWDFTTPGQAKASTAGGGGNVSNSGTPTVGQYAKWVTATTIQGVAPATVLSDIGAQPAGSYQPLDGDLTAIAALTGTNTIYYRSAASTWTAVTIGTGLTFTSGTLAATGGSGTATPVPPQGRLTISNTLPVMTSTVAGATIVWYLPYAGNLVPIYDGTSFAMAVVSAGGLFCATTDTTKNPAAIGASKVNDWFIWSDSGTIRIGHGPDWTSDTVRSAGTALVMVNGILLNNASITNGPAAQRGTYVGTTRSNASSQFDWIYGATGAAAAMVSGFFGVWNAYNRVSVVSMTGEETSNWTYATATWRSANARTENRHSAVFGLAEDPVEIMYVAPATGSASVNVAIGVGVDVTNAPSGSSGFGGTAAVTAQQTANYKASMLGYHFFQAIEYSTAASATFFGKVSTYAQQGLWFKANM